ncbi:MAG: methyltransferase domain-containing protein [Anaerolineae bacterium]|nr:methyltransferase domain-containing protein [Anaerolineae bacterium]
MNQNDYSLQRYLSAKRTVDDRSLSQRVWRRLEDLINFTYGIVPLKMLEIGCGTGAMLYRMLDACLFKKLEYLGIDSVEENIQEANLSLPIWAQKNGWRLSQIQQGSILTCDSDYLQIHFERKDFFDLLSVQPPAQLFDLIAAHAFLDLIHFPGVMQNLVALTEPGGLWYFTINFDGLTILEPEIDPVFDEEVMRLYHLTMDERKINGVPSGDSRTGRRLFTWLRKVGMEILEAGSSDWVVFSQNGQYPADEGYFLSFLLDTIYKALAGNPVLDQKRFESWTLRRQQQIEQRELVYIAHQMDFLARKPLSHDSR